MKRVAVAGAMLAALNAVPVLAQGESVPGGYDLSSASGAVTGRFYLAPMATHSWEDSSRGTDDGWGGTLAIGKQISPALMMELSGFYVKHNVDGDSTDLKLKGYGLSGLLFPFGGSLFAIGSVYYGDSNFHAGADGGYHSLDGDLGLGMLFGPIGFLNGGSLRLEGRYRIDHHSEPGDSGKDEYGDAIANIGFLIPLGAQAKAGKAAAPVAVVAPAGPVDSDGDGVPDNLDQCPGTPFGEPVDEVGCPLPNCKTPEPGQPVTLDGCAAGDKIVLRGVNFEYDQSRLTSNARAILDGVSDALSSAPQVTVEIGGHTDARGTDEYNQALSERRAASVVQYLVGKGIDSSRMTSKGYGESQPVADNETDEGRELNRRVELKVTGGVAQ